MAGTPHRYVLSRRAPARAHVAPIFTSRTEYEPTKPHTATPARDPKQRNPRTAQTPAIVLFLLYRDTRIRESTAARE